MCCFRFGSVATFCKNRSGAVTFLAECSPPSAQMSPADLVHLVNSLRARARGSD
jgi:hypothetical protein